MGLEVDSMTVVIEEQVVLDDVTFEIPTGSTIAIVGPSGVGKSTLLRVIAGILEPTRGVIRLDGHDVTQVPAHARRIGMVFQDDQLFPHLSVADNIAFGLDSGGSQSRRWTPSRSARLERHRRRNERVREMLDLVGLDGFGHRRVQGLSGGEAKRVALARALAPIPRVLLLDEPLTGLDRELHDRLLSDLASILESTRTTAVIVTHDMGEAESLAQRIVHLARPTRSAGAEVPER